MTSTQTFRRNALTVLGIILALSMIAVITMNATSAAFSASTQNDGNVWELGVLTLVDDDNDVPMFDLSGLNDGSTGERCIELAYSEDLDDQIDLILYGTTGSETGLNDNVVLDIDHGTGSTFGADPACDGFVSAGDAFDGTLAEFNETTAANPAHQIDNIEGTDTIAYRFSFTITADDADQGDAATSTFTWTAQS